MSDVLLKKIEKVIQSLQEPEVCHYLDQAFKSFSAGAYDAAIVMAWSATVAYLVREVNQIGPEVFQYAFRKEYPDRRRMPNGPEELVGDDDRAFIQVCQQMRFLRVASDDLHRFRDRRNKGVHPNQTPANEDDARQYLALCLSVVSHPTQDVHILDDALLVEYALEIGSSAETIVKLVHPEYRLSTATKLLEAYFSNSGPQYDALVSVWRQLWDLLAETDRQVLWPKLVDAVDTALDGRDDFRSGEDIARFIVWPLSDEEHSHRDSIAERYIYHLKTKVREGSFSDEDKEFALWLYNRLPKDFQEQIVRLCTLWLVHRVKRGDFTGADLDFNAWLKAQSRSDQQVRFQIIRDAIVRRY
ncbi:MAG TPA: hypothetical protein PL027_07480 [Thermosynergistes sp.]|nr:hypothetical protein [Thermosynergistes sp.]